jgi:nitrite reductase/ring-hydroxylating ferredoxin subunit
MEAINTKIADAGPSAESSEVFDAGRVEDLPHGNSKTIDLPEGRELALFNVNGEFYATENFCPHKGAPLSNGLLCAHVIECDWHGWQFDVRTGECLTVREKLETYEVVVEGDRVKILI